MLGVGLQKMKKPVSWTQSMRLLAKSGLMCKTKTLKIDQLSLKILSIMLANLKKKSVIKKATLFMKWRGKLWVPISTDTIYDSNFNYMRQIQNLVCRLLLDFECSPGEPQRQSSCSMWISLCIQDSNHVDIPVHSR